MKRRLTASIALFGLATTFTAGAASADYNVRGRFLYRDRAFGIGGFTGSDTNKPIRFADVEVIDAANVVLGLGATDANGDFNFPVVDSQTRDLRIRALTRANATPSLKLRVLRTTDSAVFALTTSVFTAHAPTQDIDFSATPLVGVQGAGGEAFNIFDVGVDGFDFIASQTGSRPNRLLTIFWALNSSDGSYYQNANASIHLVGLSNDSDAYDDTVILHEIGHYTETTLADSDNPGGAHALNGLYDLRLTWSEGVSTFFNNMVRNWLGIARPEIYVDTAGQPGPGQAFLAFEAETPTFNVPGANNEVAVNAALWEIVDGPATLDASPGVDDDGLNLATGASDFFDVFTQWIRNAQSISMEDFWDGWFALGKGNDVAMRLAFGARGIEYFHDAFEKDEPNTLARSVRSDATLEHHTLYGIGDEDWVKLTVVGGNNYVFETRNMLSAADTRLDLYFNDGITFITSNDDRGPGDVSSRIQWTAPLTTLVYLRCKRKADIHTYGSYDLLISGPTVADVMSDVRLAAVAGGVELRWRAEFDADFSHFEIERSVDAAASWSRRNTEPIVGSADGSDLVFFDATVPSGTNLAYRIVAVDSDGSRQVFGPYEITIAPQMRLALQPPRPNPFNPTTSLTFELPVAGVASLRVFGVDGRLVRTLFASRQHAAGTHTARWDGLDDRGRAAGSGVYLVRLEASAGNATQSAILLK